MLWLRSMTSSRRSRLPEAEAAPAQPSRDDGARALELAYRFINHRERTVAEVIARLQRAGLPAEPIEVAISELVELGYLDDARFARVFADDKRNLEAWGAERIARVLGERGIDRALIADVVSPDDDEATELDRALEILVRRFPKPVSDPRERQRALGVLVRKGYDSEVAYDAVRAWAGGDLDN